VVHLESFLEDLEDLEIEFKSILPGQQDKKFKLLNLICLMKISNSLEVIAESVSVDQNHGGVVDHLGDINSAIHQVRSELSNLS